MEFKVGDIFSILNGRGITQEEITENIGTFPAIQSGEENNGVIGKIDLDYCKFNNYVFCESPCLAVARTGSAGFVSFHKNGCVVGDSAKLLITKTNGLNELHYLFLQTILNQNRFKYSYGRKVTELKYSEEIIKLPAVNDPLGIWKPDWQFMEQYIKSLQYKPLTTLNSKNDSKLKHNCWKEFKVGQIFKCEPTAMLVKDDLDDGSIPFISRSAEDNGCVGYVSADLNYLNDKGCLTIGAEGVYSFYQNTDFVAGNKVYTLRNKNLNVFNAMFVCTVLNKEAYKFSYGRARVLNKLKEEVIYLPAIPDEKSDNGFVPDWKYMENYIQSLPYGDRLK